MRGGGGQRDSEPGISIEQRQVQGRSDSLNIYALSLPPPWRSRAFATLDSTSLPVGRSPPSRPTARFQPSSSATLSTEFSRSCPNRERAHGGLHRQSQLFAYAHINAHTHVHPPPLEPTPPRRANNNLAMTRTVPVLPAARFHFFFSHPPLSTRIPRRAGFPPVADTFLTPALLLPTLFPRSIPGPLTLAILLCLSYVFFPSLLPLF